MLSRALRGSVRSTFPDASGTCPAEQDISVPLVGNHPDTYVFRQMPSTLNEPWHPANIAARIDAQVGRLGVSRTALLKAARVPEKAIRDLEAGHWPNLRRIVQLAAAFKFRGGIGELLGLANESENRCDPRLLHVALELVAQAMDARKNENPLQTQPHVVAGLAAIAHQQLVELHRIDSNATSNTAALYMISAMLRSELANFDREKS